MQVDIEQPDALLTYLRQSQRIAQDEQPSMRTLAGGVSNRTVLVERPNGEAWVLKQALSKLRVAVDWFSSPERIHREALGLRWLMQIAPPGTITPFIFEDHAQHILAMQAVPLPHENWKSVLLRGEVDHEHVAQFAQLLASIHQAARANPELADIFNDRSFFESLRLEPYYSYTATEVPAAQDFYTALIAETRTQRVSLVHGDYSPKNVLVYQDRLVLLDHEVIHFGDPAFDVGFSMTHLLSKAHHIPEQRAAFASAAQHYWQVYTEAWRELNWQNSLEARAINHTLGCLLARVAGRSPLEYLDAAERARQRGVVLALIDHLPQTMPELIETFVEHIEASQG